jgi:ATP/maltotriose-dependent transcriptional regulator MalT
MADLERGRERYAERAWASAHESFSRADESSALGADDLERFAISAYLVGRDDEYLELLQRAYHTHVAVGAGASAARTAFWIGLRLLFRSETGHANGWFGRAQRLLEREAEERVEAGYLLLGVAQQRIGAGELDAALASAESAVAIGERFSDADLVATARHLIGRVRLQQGRVSEGLLLLDEAMVAVAGGELSPIVTGLVYCSVIDGCREVYALGRSREWTSALAAWCEGQPEMVAFTGICGVHRAEVLELHGAWSQALGEAERASSRVLGLNQTAASAAFHLEGDVHRLRGNFEAADQAYRRAGEHGREPQPGLSLSMLAEGRKTAAAASIRRALATTKEPFERARLLPAGVEIFLAKGAAEEAAAACCEMESLATTFDSAVLRAMAEHARGAVELAVGDPSAALQPLRNAYRTWQETDAPYHAARTRVLVGRCYQALGDVEGGKIEIAAARKVFERLGALPDLAVLDSLATRSPDPETHPLTARELEVLRLVAAGNSNKAIAAELSLSEKTVERHVSNIFTKLDVPSRTAAAAYAYQQKLV